MLNYAINFVIYILQCMGFIVGIPRTCGRFATFKMSSFVLLMPKYYSFAYHDIMHDVIGGDKISFIPQKTA